MPKRKRLTVREVKSIAKELKSADLDTVQVVVKEVQKEQHICDPPRENQAYCAGV